METLRTRTVSPSVHPRHASGVATDFFPASALSSPTGLATSRWRRRTMRPTDVCHPNELRAPAPRVFPARSRHFRSVDAPRSLRLRTAGPGDRTLHVVRRPLRRIVIEHAASPSCDGERGRFLPTVLMQSSLWHSCRDLWIRSPPHEPSLVLQPCRAPRFWSGVRVGECRDRQDHHYRRLVKADAS